MRPVSAADFAGRKKRIYADPGVPRRVPAARRLGRRSASASSTMVISEYAPDRTLEERALADGRGRARRRTRSISRSTSRSRPISRRASASRSLNTDEEAVAELLAHPATMLGLSDAGAHASQLCDACFSTAPARALGAREARAHARGGRAPADQRSRPRCSASATAAASRAGSRPTSRSSTPRRVGCSPLRRVHDFPARRRPPRRRRVGHPRRDRQRPRHPRGRPRRRRRRRPLPGRVLAEEALRELPDHLRRLAHHRAAEHLHRLHRPEVRATRRRAWSTSTRSATSSSSTA